MTGDKRAGIRNYGMNASPLNYSDVGYDFARNAATCPLLTQADGEIWSATNYDIRQAMNARYGSGDAALQAACARGDEPAGDCPGNRWAQLVFDAWVLMASGSVSMLDARDATLAADLVRFGGPNQDLLWNTFARRGLGEGSEPRRRQRRRPGAGLRASPFANEATVTFAPAAEALGRSAQLYVGRYEARASADRRHGPEHSARQHVPDRARDARPWPVATASAP